MSSPPPSPLCVPLTSCTNSGLRLPPRSSSRSPASPEADMEADRSPRMTGCGLFRRRRSRSTSSIPHVAPPPTDAAAKEAHGEGSTPGRRRRGSVEMSLVPALPPASPPAVNTRSPVPSPRAIVASPRRPSEQRRTTMMPPPGNGVMADLDSMLYDRHRAGDGCDLVRVSSGNVMVYGNLGNLRGNANLKSPPSRDVLDYVPRTPKEPSGEMEAKAKNDHPQLTTTTPTKQGTANAKKSTAKEKVKPAPELCRALSRRQDPEELKEMGNKEFKKGRFAEALALYDQAIVMDPGKASHYNNKAAALAGMGKLFEAVEECKEATRIDPNFYKAHHRLAYLYLRWGEAEKAIYHFNLSRNEASRSDISKAQVLQSSISKSHEARKLQDYFTLLKESLSAASSGADSAPQVFALQAEGLLRLNRHDDAYSTLSSAPELGIDKMMDFFGAPLTAYLLMIQSQVEMATGRFDEAVATAQKAAQLDPSNREIGAVVRRTRLVATARSRGNDLFRASKFAEACTVYGEGLDHDSHNAVLLYNRAACRCKLVQYEKAIEDCNIALAARPSYSKARRRRADCNAKLERWEASIKDYGVLLQEFPRDEEVSQAMSEAQAKLKKQQQEGEHLEGTAQP